MNIGGTDIVISHHWSQEMMMNFATRVIYRAWDRAVFETENVGVFEHYYEVPFGLLKNKDGMSNLWIWQDRFCWAAEESDYRDVICLMATDNELTLTHDCGPWIKSVIAEIESAVALPG